MYIAVTDASQTMKHI